MGTTMEIYVARGMEIVYWSNDDPRKGISCVFHNANIVLHYPAYAWKILRQVVLMQVLGLVGFY